MAKTKNSTPPYLMIAPLIISICILIIGCNNVSQNQTISKDESCRLVKHQMGETKVCGTPEKVVALSPHILDSILALGVQPIAYAETINLNIQVYDNPAQQIPYIGKWITTQPVALGDRKSPSLERLTMLKPDLIIGEDWLHKDEYSLLSQIAPTLLFTDQPRTPTTEEQSWQYDIDGIAKALGKETEVDKLVKDFEKKIEITRQILQPVVEKYPRVFLMSTNVATNFYAQPDSTTAKLLEKIGFQIVKLSSIVERGNISQEVLPQIEADIIIVLSWNEDDFYSPESILREKWATNPLLNTMSVFQEGRVFFVDYQLWGSNIRGPLTDLLILEKLPDLLLTTLKNSS
ncbi:iron-siderophore ABC transporter substrate-binding protein [Cyanobacterium aponinum UTEX 3221]|uniref:iron-siderophore ABC transporter substrate-binding protein n=1 Tax=Cyanobacterium aponinum TaxID=379064 RepID=UPI002B4BA4D9|nr:iron-siderophore ABC transporter substrate-binding protein [Cyanobacterium aponinum]WRL38583.1 iron-siderophore ABC transporter substrate-binding protein [Cyanobacterium aponinum UTEX 3221]